jgi:signal peptidase II
MVIGLSFFLIFNKQLSLPQIICLSCLIGGGASNLFDRIFHNNLVTDFMIFKIYHIQTGILNFADLSITFGALFLLFSQYIQMKKLQKKDNC